MRRVALSVLALALIVAPAVAQYETSPSPLQSPPIQEDRTNPDAPAITGDSGLTVTGTVVSFTDSAVVLDTAVGHLTVQFDNNTVKPDTLAVNDRVAIDYTRTSTGVMIAQSVRPAGEVGTTLATDPPVTTDTTPLGESTLENDQGEMDSGTATGLESDTSELPETGSELPLIGALGLLALLAAVSFRVSRHSA